MNIKISKVLASTRHTYQPDVKKSSDFIRSGDSVTISLVGQNQNSADADVKYLSTHRGWWLKWVNAVSKQNGVFIIQCVDDAEAVGGRFHNGETAIAPFDTAQQLVAIGSPFILRHKRWENFIVGVREESSVKFGGRLMALFKSSSSIDPEFDLSNPWVKPLKLCANLAPCAPPSPKVRNVLASNVVLPLNDVENDDLNDRQLPNNCIFDITAWIEMVDRRKRKRQLAYVVRCRAKIPQEIEKKENEFEVTNLEQTSFFTLRTGMDLVPIVQQWRSSTGFSSLRSAVRSQLHANW